MTHFLQGPEWANLQQSLGREQASGEGNGWSYRAYLEKGRLGTRLYCPYGPVVESDDALREAVASLLSDAKRLGASYIRVEPTGSFDPGTLTELSLARVDHKQPEHTQRVDLRRDFSEILAEMQSTVRNLHRNYHKKGLEVIVSDSPADVEHLISLLGEVSSRTGMHAHDSDYLRATANSLIPQGAAKMYLVRLDGEVIAASLIFDDATTRYYAHAAADTEHRRLKAGTIIVSKMIEDAAQAGQLEFDLYGVVPPEVKGHEWSGFSEFKRSFGGYQVDYAGTWELPVNKLKYKLNQTVHGIYNKIRPAQ